MPADGAVQIAFDRYLLPLSVTRQSVTITTANDQVLPPEQSPNVIYDPVAKTVTITRPALDRPWLDSGVPYKVRFALPKSDDDPIGLRSLDGASLLPTQPLEYAFFVAPATGSSRSLAATLGEPESVSFCKDVLPIFQAKCSVSTCHGDGPRAAASLVLSTPDGVRRTAINRVSQGSNTGGLAGQPRAESTRFGIDMPIIAVEQGSTPIGSPGNSWLLYKVEIADPPAAPGQRRPFSCTQGTDRTAAQASPYTPLAPVLPAGDPAERARLRDQVLGNQMPYPILGTAVDYEEQTLTFQERETLRMWIARGAETPDCGLCTF